MNTRVLDLIWGTLLAATLLTWLIGKSVRLDTPLVVAVLVIAAVKGWLIIYDFMALRRVRFFWRAVVLGWLLLTLAVILLAYWLGLK